jgi:vacuolar-type H+-ATPase subunit H
MSFNPKTEFEKYKLINPNLKEPPTLDKFDKKYFYIYFGPDIPLDIFMKNLGVSEDLAFLANKYGKKELITKIIIKNNKQMRLDIIKHIFFNTTNKIIDKNDLIFLVSTEYFKGNSGVLLRLIRERCENINVSMIAFNYLEGVIKEANIFSILIKCNGFCDFGFKDPKNSDIKRLYAGITNEKLKFIEFFCTKTNIDCVKGQIGHKEIVNSDMTPFHIAIWQCGFSLCDIINFYLENNISSLPTPLNWISFLRIPLKFLCEIDCINMLTRNPATLLSTTTLPAFVKKVLLECNPAVCTVITSRSGISSVLSGTGLDFILVPGRFLCETVCCGSESTSICNCCKTLRIRDLKNKFSIYKKMAICMTNFLCEMTKKAEFLNDVFAINELRQFILFMCNLIQNPNFKENIENKMNIGIQEVINVLEESQTISFDDFFIKLVNGQVCSILKGYSKILGGQISVILNWVCEKFSEIANEILKGIFRIIKDSIQDINSMISKPTLEQVIKIVVDVIVSKGLLCKAVKDKLPSFWGIERVCSQCSEISKNLLTIALRGSLPSLGEIADRIVVDSCLKPCDIIKNSGKYLGINNLDILCSCSNLIGAFAKNIIKGQPPSPDEIGKEVLKCSNPCNMPGLSIVCSKATEWVTTAAFETAKGVTIAAETIKEISQVTANATTGYAIKSSEVAIEKAKEAIEKAEYAANQAAKEAENAANEAKKIASSISNEAEKTYSEVSKFINDSVSNVGSSIGDQLNPFNW